MEFAKGDDIVNCRTRITTFGCRTTAVAREGDMVIARDEDGGVTGVFPVTAIMQRQAASVVYLTLENASGATSVLGVTAEHPLHSGGDWLQAGELAPGDVIVDSALLPLTVLAVRVDATPQLVHNLEIGGAHTYFAGEMEAWAHNGKWGQRIALMFQLGTSCIDDQGTQDPADDIINIFSGELEPEELPRDPGTRKNRTRRPCPFRNERSRITKFLIGNR